MGADESADPDAGRVEAFKGAAAFVDDFHLVVDADAAEDGIQEDFLAFHDVVGRCPEGVEEALFLEEFRVVLLVVMVVDPVDLRREVRCIAADEGRDGGEGIGLQDKVRVGFRQLVQVLFQVVQPGRAVAGVLFVRNQAVHAGAGRFGVNVVVDALPEHALEIAQDFVFLHHVAQRSRVHQAEAQVPGLAVEGGTDHGMVVVGDHQVFVDETFAVEVEQVDIGAAQEHLPYHVPRNIRPDVEGRHERVAEAVYRFGHQVTVAVDPGVARGDGCFGKVFFGVELFAQCFVCRDGARGDDDGLGPDPQGFALFRGDEARNLLFPVHDEGLGPCSHEEMDAGLFAFPRQDIGNDAACDGNVIAFPDGVARLVARARCGADMVEMDAFFAFEPVNHPGRSVDEIAGQAGIAGPMGAFHVARENLVFGHGDAPLLHGAAFDGKHVADDGTGAAGEFPAFHNGDIVRAGLFGRQGGGQAGAAGSDDEDVRSQIEFFHETQPPS